MAEARFIKTVTFGGYDKVEVVRRLEYLNSRVYDLENELRETKLLLDAYKKGTDEEKANETVLIGERNKLTQLQVQNDTLNTKLKAAEFDNKNYEQEVKKLNEKNEELTEKLKNAAAKLKALEANDEAVALSSVFIEAQKSAAMLESSAKAKFNEIEASSKALAESTINDANIEAAQIIYEAEKKAAETIADAKNQSEQMNVASNNLRVVALDKVVRMKETVTAFASILQDVWNEGTAKITEAQGILDGAENTLNNGGVPVFIEPKKFDPDLPEKPMSLYEKLKGEAQVDEEEKQKKKNELDKLRQMAEAIGNKKDEAEAEPKNSEAKPKTDLAALAAKAESLNKDDKKDKKDGGKGKLSLAELAAKAKSIDKK